MCDIMKNRVEKLQELKQEVFSLKDASMVGLDFYDIKVLEKEGKVIKSKRGIYQKSSFTDYENEVLYNAIAKMGTPSVICLLSAFFYYGLTDEIPDQTWIYVPLKKYSHDKSLKIIRKSSPKWTVGVSNINGLRITNVERTVVDALSDKKHVADTEAMKIARESLKQKLTSLKNITKMAKELGVFDRIKFQLTLLQDEYV